MKLQLTQKNVHTLGEGEYRDTDLPRFILRVRGERRTYSLKYERHGETIRVPLGTVDELTLKEARDKARPLLAGVWTGVDPREAIRRQDAAGLTVGQLARKCLDAVSGSLRPATLQGYEEILARELPPIADHVAAAVTSRQLIAFFDDMLPKANHPLRPDGQRPRSGWIANRTHEFLRRVYRWGVDREMLAASPIATLKRQFVERANERFLSADEMRAFVRAVDDIQDHSLRKVRRKGKRSGDPRAACAMLLALTGLRVSAVVGARAEEFEDLETEGAAMWRVPAIRMKSGRAHSVPLSRQAAVIVRRRLEEIADGPGPLLFPRRRRGTYEPIDWESYWVKWLKAGVDRHLGRKAERWRIHDLRTTLSTHMSETLDIPPHVIDKILDHAPEGPRVRRTYNKATLLDARRQALQKYADWIDGLRRSGMVAVTGTEGA